MERADTIVDPSACLALAADRHAQHRQPLAHLHSEVRRFAGSKVRNSADVDDITQQTFLQALRNLDEFRGNDLRAWVFAIARRLIIDGYRAQGRVQFVEIDEENLQRKERALQSAPDLVEATCTARERIRCCLACIATLTPVNAQVAILLADVHGFSDQESATRLSISLSSFKAQLHKARRCLHATAGHECPLVSKKGMLGGCPDCTHQAGGKGAVRRRRGAAPARPSDLAVVAVLHQELVNALEMDRGHARNRVARLEGA